MEDGRRPLGGVVRVWALWGAATLFGFAGEPLVALARRQLRPLLEFVGPETIAYGGDSLRVSYGRHSRKDRARNEVVTVEPHTGGSRERVLSARSSWLPFASSDGERLFLLVDRGAGYPELLLAERGPMGWSVTATGIEATDPGGTRGADMIEAIAAVDDGARSLVMAEFWRADSHGTALVWEGSLIEGGVSVPIRGPTQKLPEPWSPQGASLVRQTGGCIVLAYAVGGIIHVDNWDGHSWSRAWYGEGIDVAASATADGVLIATTDGDTVSLLTTIGEDASLLFATRARGSRLAMATSSSGASIAVSDDGRAWILDLASDLQEIGRTALPIDRTERPQLATNATGERLAFTAGWPPEELVVWERTGDRWERLVVESHLAAYRANRALRGLTATFVVSGLLPAVAQWLVLRRLQPAAWRWVPATGLAWCAGVWVGGIVDGELGILCFALTVGLAQWLVLRRECRYAWVWPFLVLAGTMVAWAPTAVIRDPLFPSEALASAMAVPGGLVIALGKGASHRDSGT